MKIVADQLKRWIRPGSVLESIEIRKPEWHGSKRHGDFATDTKTKAKKRFRLKRIMVRGKQMVWMFDDEKNPDDPVFLGIHFMMTGHFRAAAPEKSGHLVFHFVDPDGNQKPVYLEDPRDWAKFEWMNRNELDELLAKLGPSIMVKSTTAAQFRDAMRRSPTKLIVTAMKDQDKVSGIGNYIRSEALYRAKISPKKKVKDLTDQQLDKIWRSVRAVVTDVLKHGGSSNYSDFHGKSGGYKFRVYKQKTDPKGNPVKKLKLDGQTVYYGGRSPPLTP